MEDLNFGEIFLWEMFGDVMLALLGVGVVANVLLAKTKGNNDSPSPLSAGWLLINFGWGLAVFAGVYVSLKSGAHINPAVTFGMAVEGTTEWSDVPAYVLGQIVGAFIGASLAWAAYRQHYDEPADPAAKLGTFSTGPQIRNYGWNFVTEAIATFVLVISIFAIAPHGGQPSDLGPLAVALIVVGIGASLGGPTGYAINPARDLGPRIAHAVLPIKGKGSSDWAYSWVPIAGPLAGGVLAGLLANAISF